MSREEACALLGVATDANKDDIKSAYKKMARQYHPDICKELEAESMMRQINNAFDLLMGRNIVRQRVVRPKPRMRVNVYYSYFDSTTTTTASSTCGGFWTA